MAKKKAAKKPEAAAPVYYDEPGRGRKQCPACKKYVPSAATGDCPNPACSHVFPTRQRERESEADSPMLKAFTVIDELGGLAVQKVDVESLIRSLKAISGVEWTVIEQLHRLAEYAGGWDELRAAWVKVQSRQNRS